MYKSERNISQAGNRCLCVILWLLSLAVSMMPFAVKSPETELYNLSGFCIPLPIIGSSSKIQLQSHLIIAFIFVSLVLHVFTLLCYLYISVNTKPFRSMAYLIYGNDSDLPFNKLGKEGKRRNLIDDDETKDSTKEDYKSDCDKQNFKHNAEKTKKMNNDTMSKFSLRMQRLMPVIFWNSVILIPMHVTFVFGVYSNYHVISGEGLTMISISILCIKCAATPVLHLSGFIQHSQYLEQSRRLSQWLRAKQN